VPSGLVVGCRAREAKRGCSLVVWGTMELGVCGASGGFLFLWSLGQS